ncbi:hypothetical protein D3C76_811100 [compost metagenome]
MADGFQRAGLDRGVLGAFTALVQRWAGFQYLVAEAVAFTEQQQALVVEHGGVDGLFRRPRVVGRHQGAERFIVQRQGQHVGFVERQGDDHRVQFAVAQLFAQYVGEVLFDVQRHLRRHAVQLRDQVREQIRADGIDGTDLERGGQLVLAGLGQLANALGLLQYLLRLGDDVFADRGQAYCAFAALEDQNAKLVLELLHTDRQGRLAHVAAFGGMAEVLFLGECDDVA